PGCTRRWPRPRATTPGSPSSTPSSRRSRRSGRRSRPSGWSSPSASASEPARAPPRGDRARRRPPAPRARSELPVGVERREQRAQVVGERALGLLVEPGEQLALAAQQVGEGRVDAGHALLGERDEHPAAVLRVRAAPYQPGRGEPVDAVRHRARGDERGPQQLAGAQLVRRARPAQRGEHVELPRLQPVLGERGPARPVEVLGEPGHPAEHVQRAHVEVRPLLAPGPDQPVDLVLDDRPPGARAAGPARVLRALTRPAAAFHHVTSVTLLTSGYLTRLSSSRCREISGTRTPTGGTRTSVPGRSSSCSPGCAPPTPPTWSTSAAAPASSPPRSPRAGRTRPCTASTRPGR